MKERGIRFMIWAIQALFPNYPQKYFPYPASHSAVFTPTYPQFFATSKPLFTFTGS